MSEPRPSGIFLVRYWDPTTKHGWRTHEDSRLLVPARVVSVGFVNQDEDPDVLRYPRDHTNEDGSYWTDYGILPRGCVYKTLVLPFPEDF